MHLPARTFFGIEVFLQKVLVVLLNVGIDPPIFAVDDDSHQIGFGCGDVSSCDVRIQHGGQHRVIAMRVEQIERFVTQNLLIAVRHVSGHIERTFVARWNVIV